MIDKAIILAAGLGNRISKIAANTPKPLLQLSLDDPSITFLDWHIWTLADAGVREIYLVGNARTFGTQLRAAKERSSEKLRVTWILNPTEDISTSGSGHSAQFAFHHEANILDGASRVVLMDADILYHPRIWSILDTASQGSTTLVCSDYRETNEEVMVFAGADGKPVLHGKGLLQTPLTERLTCQGEASGILLWDARDHQALKATTDWIMQYSTAKARSEHEDITQRMFAQGRVATVGFDKGTPFMECDTPEEYEVLRRELFPLLRREASFLGTSRT
jgi:choline kinase